MLAGLVHMCAYQGVRNISFSEYFAHVLNGYPLLFYNKNLKPRNVTFQVKFVTLINQF